ncbi:NAD(P)H-binding protein [Xanthomonadaceae bacterium XH05]|nr:NAD(P)H-binding protein [Xanthomonadaceae bacterium XH05]
MRALVLGATGQIGRFLLQELVAHGVEVEAVSRDAQSLQPGVGWRRFDLYVQGDAMKRPDVVFSAGPLDGLLAWLSRTRHRPARIVAFSSTSAATKQDSPDAAERELALHLQRCERALEMHCDARGIGWTILRPTLVYGCGLDANLSRIAALARRWRLVPLPSDAVGLRQPVHAHDLAVCARVAANTGKSLRKRYDLCGGEALSYLEMVRRTVACLQPPARILLLPPWLFRGVAHLAARLRVVTDFGPGMLERMRQDLVFDAAAAARDLDWSPRPFRPEPGNFPDG